MLGLLIQLLGAVFLSAAILACLYYVLLAFVAFMPKKHSKQSFKKNGIYSFAIVIPAHNEEKTISNALLSCAELDYPKDKYNVFVVADNCSDLTSEIATRSGVICLERYDEENKGKGFALEWAFERILPEGHDAVIVLDADCRIDKHALKVFDRYLEDGDQVLQAKYVTSNPDENAISYTFAVGNLIENDLFCAPKSRLGLAVFLRGTGMVFQRSVLERIPWQAHSVVEDIEYTLHLIKNRILVRFVNEVGVLSEFPVNQKQLMVQRTRWAGGNLRFGKIYALKLILEGIFKGRFILLDFGCSLLVLSRPLVLLELLIAVMLGALSVWILQDVFSNALLCIGLVLILIQWMYFGLGVFLLGITPQRMALLFKTPAVLVRLMLLSFLGILRINQDTWVRTPRK